MLITVLDLAEKTYLSQSSGTAWDSVATHRGAVKTRTLPLKNLLSVFSSWEWPAGVWRLERHVQGQLLKGMGPRACSRGLMDRRAVRTVSHAYETGSQEQFPTLRLWYFCLTGHHTQMPAESWFHREKATEILLNGASPGTRPTYTFPWRTLVCVFSALNHNCKYTILSESF